MGREYPDYRPYLELISNLYPGRTELKVSTEIPAMLGVSKRTVYDRYHDIIFDGAIGVIQLARAMCDEEKKKRKVRPCTKSPARPTPRPR